MGGQVLLDSFNNAPAQSNRTGRDYLEADESKVPLLRVYFDLQPGP
jgi:hypothetical protein